MRRVSTALGLLATTALLALPLATPSYAADGASIDHVQTGQGAVKMLVSVPGNAAVDLSTVHVTIDSQDAEATAENASATGDVQRTTVLAIDTSNSMRGARLTEARKAALAYLDAVPANVSVGVITFSSTVNQLLAPGLDRAAARAAVSHLTLARQTSLYDGVAAAVAATGSTGQREVLVLSDGKDTTATTLASVVAKIKASGVKVDAVSLEASDQTNQPLIQMTTAGKGTVLNSADPKGLSAAFAGEAQVLARQVLVTATVPASQKATDANVAVTLGSGGQTYTASAFVVVRPQAHGAATPTTDQTLTPVKSGLKIPTSVAIAAIVVIGLAVVVLIFGLFSAGSKEGSQLSVAEQIGNYGASGVHSLGRSRDDAGRSTNDKAATLSLTDQARGVAEKALANSQGLEARIAQRLDAAGMAVKPAEWVLIHAGIAIGAGLIGGLLGTGNPLLIVLFLAVGVIGPWLYLGIKRVRRLRAFEAGLADTLQLMAGSLSAGLSLAQSLDTIVREGAEPISSEFRRVIVESRLGVTIEDSLEGVAARMESKDFAWVVMAIRIQRQVGGNLAELLLTVAATLREREYLRRHVQALSAEGRLSCWILGALPPGFLAYLTLTKPDYVHPMFTTPIGWLMCIGMAVLLTVGIFWMSKVAKVEL